MSDTRTNVLGVGISAVNPVLALQTIIGWIDRRQHQYVCVTGVHGVMESQRNETLRGIHNRSGMVTPDGMPMVWLSKLSGHRHVDRVYGPDLMLSVCAASPALGYRHFLYGGNDGVAELLAERLRARFPGLEIVGTHTPPFRPLSAEEDAAVVEQINQSGAQIVWVGLSTPKQEQWMASHLGRLDANVLLGVGAAFDFHAGLVPQAPRWVQRSGFEWGYRLLTNPRRLWKRYLSNNPTFVFRVVQQRLGLKTYPLPQIAEGN
jgi:N-acetylglucosaminyldiphosphoundecaprenol N-acetyl-beta-D-mannosaminyltransferase